MEIIGNVEKADKFFVYKNDGSIEWVPQLAIAKAYVKNVNNKNWYNKNIYATSENITRLTDGRLFLQSQAPIEKIKINRYTEFCVNALSYLDKLLFDFVKEYKYASLEEMLSWKSSTIKQKAADAKIAFSYRDKLYKYYFKFIEDNKEILSTDDTSVDLSEVYSKFLNKLPKVEDTE